MMDKNGPGAPILVLMRHVCLLRTSYFFLLSSVLSIAKPVLEQFAMCLWYRFADHNEALAFVARSKNKTFIFNRPL